MNATIEFTLHRIVQDCALQRQEVLADTTMRETTKAKLLRGIERRQRRAENLARQYRDLCGTERGVH